MLADTPGTCTSLFIYGKSGLGKTHLLLAIKNELAEKSPEIKVKYANSQAYLDDLMTEFDRQKKSNAPIMQAYHGVDVLIIDDIQNIIGKRASVDYFFQLMDEFIRNNKKVVIAADRDVRYEQVVNVMKTLQNAEIKRVGLALKVERTK